MQVFKEVFTKWDHCFLGCDAFPSPKISRKRPILRSSNWSCISVPFFFVSANSCRICFPCWHCSLHGRALEFGGRAALQRGIEGHIFLGSFGAMVKTWLGSWMVIYPLKNPCNGYKNHPLLVGWWPSSLWKQWELINHRPHIWLVGSSPFF